MIKSLYNSNNFKFINQCAILWSFMSARSCQKRTGKTYKSVAGIKTNIPVETYANECPTCHACIGNCNKCMMRHIFPYTCGAMSINSQRISTSKNLKGRFVFPRRFVRHYSPWVIWCRNVGRKRQIAASVIAQGAKDVRRTMEMELQAELAIQISSAKE